MFYMQRDKYPEVLAAIDRDAPNLRPLVCPKDYIAPHGYGDLTSSMLSAYVAAVAVAGGKPAAMDTTIYAVHITHCMMIRYQMPTYFVSRELCEALLRTEAPEDMLFEEIMMPMPAMRFILPEDFSVEYFGWPTPYITAAMVPAGYRADTPIKLFSAPVRGVDVQNPKTHFNATMLDWEDGYPMHYDSRAPVNYRIKDLLNAPTELFDRNPLLDAHQDPKRDKFVVDRLTTLAVNIILGMTAEPELISRERILRPTKKAGKTVLRRALWRPNIIGEHFRITYEKSLAPGTHRSPHVHWRNGHWRNQRHGPFVAMPTPEQPDRKLPQFVKRLWIKPVFVGLGL
jgi:hypothetical protein